MHSLKDGGYLTGNFQNLNEIKLNKELVNGVILDFRDNPCGSLISAVRISDMFIKKENRIVAIDASGEENDIMYKATDFTIFDDVPVAVILNEQSASASELVASAIITNHKYSFIVGRKSYGKGSVQQRIPFSDGSSLRITVAEYLPSGYVRINGVGVPPDINVK